MTLQTQQKAILIAGSSAVLLLGVFLYVRKRNQQVKQDGDEEEKELEFADLNAGEESVASAGQSSVKVLVPQHMIGGIIGKEGSRIKQLRAEFGVRFNFDREEDEKGFGERDKHIDRILEIKGQREKVRAAEHRINAIIADTPKNVELEVFVPLDACGRIIGKGGLNIRDMCSVSGAKIVVERSELKSLGNQRKIFLSGTKSQVEYAKLLINEKVEQVKSEAHQYNFKDVKSTTFPTVNLPHTGGYFQVFVSSFQQPDRFWVQLVSQESTKLDVMTSQLTELYSKFTPEEERLEAGNIGDICIAPFQDDGAFYRATIVKIKQDRTAELYYVDFGDTASTRLDSLKIIKDEFKELRGQAVQCILPVKPIADHWTDAAEETFHDLTHCAQWQPLMAKVLCYESSNSGELPVLQLIDTSKEEDVDIAIAMMQMGHCCGRTLQGRTTK